MANYPVVKQEFTVRTPMAQEALLVPIGDWKKYKERIKNLNTSANWFAAFGWAAMGAAVSFLVAAITFPFSVQWSEVIDEVEHIRWCPVVTELAVSSLGVLLLAFGGLALFWAYSTTKMQSEFAGLLIEDMEDLERRNAAPDA